MIQNTFTRVGAAALLFGCLAACASPAGRIERNLVRVGVAPGPAECLGVEISSRLDEERTDRFIEYLKQIDRARTPGESLDAFIDIENPLSAAAVAAASGVCLVRLGQDFFD